MSCPRTQQNVPGALAPESSVLTMRPLRLPWHRKTGHKMDDVIGQLSSTGNENAIYHFECAVLCPLPSVP